MLFGFRTTFRGRLTLYTASQRVPRRLAVARSVTSLAVPAASVIERPFRPLKEWIYNSVSGQCLNLPPKVSYVYKRPLIPADIYVHHGQSKGVFLVWVWSGDRWAVAQVHTYHPVLSGYHLKLLHNGDPSGYQENDGY